MDVFNEQISGAESRYERHRKDREERLAHLASRGDWRKIDDPRRILNRLERRGYRQLITEAMASTEADAEGHPEVDVLERILDRSDLTGIAYFYRFAALSRAVARIRVRDHFGNLMWHGSGFLVSPRLLMTNNHVIPSRVLAMSSIAQFDFYRRFDGTETSPIDFSLQPHRFFQTDKGLDFTLVAIAEVNDDGRRTSEFGYLNMIRESGKAVVGERVNIVQHPSGRPKEIAFRDNQIIDVPENFLHYRSDTQPGSSGSPVVNEDGELAALHHAGVPKRNDDGRIMLRDGRLWDGSRAQADDIAWIANEGVRISRIVSYLGTRQLSPWQRDMLEQAFQLPPPAESVLAGFAGGEGLEASPVVAGPNAPDGGERVVVEDDGSASWWIRVNVGMFGGAAPPCVTTDAPKVIPPASGDPSVKDQAKNKVEDAWHDKDYYDAETDKQDRDAYYAAIDQSGDGAQLFHAFRDLLESTHTTRLRYREARWDHLYPNVDRRESGNLRNVYSGGILDPAEVLAAEMALVERHLALLAASGQEFDVNDAAAVEALELRLEEESSHPFNCEHVVPQSWFNKKETPRADLHHLFTCEPDCNSFRSNYAYFDFDPLTEATRADCGRREGSQGSDAKFEPEFGRGAVARATLYFLLRYPGEVSGRSEMPEERLVTLKRWHKAEPVSFYERHRNAEIYNAQGNRNPLIDNPDWVDKIDFSLGLA